MKSRMSFALVAILLVGLLMTGTPQFDRPAARAGMLASAAAQGNPFQRRRECSLGTMYGAHGYTYSGYVMGAYIAIAGSINFDESGNISGTYNGTLGGNPLKGKLAGAITVDGDCTGKVRIDLPIAGVSANGTFVIVNDGKETLFTSTDSGIAVTGQTKKL
jgi:hypothetical protein